MSNFVVETVISLILIVILMTFAGPTKLAMPESTAMFLTIGLIIIFLVFAGLIWKEKARDEREEYHRSHAGRVSFLVGSSILIAAIVVQGFNHNIDPWLVYTLAGMILSKTATRIYYQLKS